MPRQQRVFTPEPRAEVVQLVLAADKPIAEIARDLGIGESTLGNWVAKAKENGRPWPTLARLRTALFTYIETYYNRKRRHSTLDYLTPQEYEDNEDRQRPHREAREEARADRLSQCDGGKDAREDDDEKREQRG